MMEAEIGDEGPQFVAPILFHLMPALEHTAQTLRISSITPVRLVIADVSISCFPPWRIHR